ncbi:MAG: LacI family DNA-binding transcriptional regulator [Ilumatobacter sp.]|uniref:LacI family DNA-binding transcriptional regulator n=1 Tax=Ilumatobacter sp. TaxID=1967498 RepID=UPI003C78832F
MDPAATGTATGTTGERSDGPVHLAEVARASGVSPAAASRALNGRDGVRDDVRQRVRHVADTLGYRPNRAAKNLAGGRTSVIGLVMPSDELRLDRYAASLVQAVANAADRHDEGLMLLLAHDEASRKVADTIRDGLVDGVVVSAIAIGARWVDELIDAEVPTVLIGSHADRPDVHRVEVENHESIGRVVEHLVEQGCERIAHVHGPLDRADARQRLEGFRAAHATLGLALDESLVVAGDYTRATGRRLTEELLERRPDAIVGANDETAIGAMRAAERAGLSIPDDIAITGFDGLGRLEGLDVALTTLLQPFEEMSDLAVASLISLLAGDDVPIHQVVHPTLQLAASSLRTGTTPS